MDVAEKLSILSAAARYDASCSSSGSSRANTPGGLGNAAMGGICHSWADDGRCISLLKVLYTNQCMYDCAYCHNRRSNDIARARFTVQEVVDLTLGFYRRNYIEGLFLSSGVTGSPDRTMEELVAVIKTLRTLHRFNGYIHLKTIPGCDNRLVQEAGLYADRLSVNIELPSRESLAALAPDKTPEAIFGPMRYIASERRNALELARRQTRLSARPQARPALAGPGTPSRFALAAAASPAAAAAPDPGPATWLPGTAPAPTLPAGGVDSAANQPAFVPAGQSTQMIVGASRESDLQIIRLTQDLYRRFDLKRVYFSAYMPVNTDPRLPALGGPPLLREHRLYQADWLLRFYRFSAEEILDEANPQLEQDLDPKTAWALRHPDFFPVDIQRASPEALLRIPGIGPRSAERIWNARQSRRLRFRDLESLGVVLKRARYFLHCLDHSPSRDAADPALLRRYLQDPASRKMSLSQLELF